MNSEGLDKLDYAILHVIKDNARMSYSEIGEQVGISRVAVKNRMDALEKNGVIQGYKTVIDDTKTPEGVSFILDVEIYPEKYHEVISLLLENKFLRKVYTTTCECRVHCIGFAPNYRTLESHVNHLYRISKGIRTMSWHMLLTALKDVDGGVDYEEYKEPEHMESGRKE